MDNKFIKKLAFFISALFFLLPPWLLSARMVKLKLPSVNVRKDPATGSPKVGVAYREQAIDVIEEHKGWLKMLLPNGVEGWIWSGLVNTAGQDDEEKYTDKEKAEMKKKEEKIVEVKQPPEKRGVPIAVKDITSRPGNEYNPIAFRIKVIKPVAEIRKGPGAKFACVGEVKQNDTLTGEGERGGWYFCRTTDGRDGWIIASSCEVLTLRTEVSQKRVETVETPIAKEDALPLATAPVEPPPMKDKLPADQEADFSAVDEGWLYEREEGEEKGEGIPGDAAYPQAQSDLYAWKGDIFQVAEKLAHYYDHQKKECIAYQSAGWFPSFTVFDKEKDIEIQPLSEEFKIKIAFSLLRISIKTLFPLPAETVPITLSKSDKIFFLTLVQAIMENEHCQEIEIDLRGLWRAKKRGPMRWTSTGGFIVKRNGLLGKDLDTIGPDEFWGLLESQPHARK